MILATPVAWCLLCLPACDGAPQEPRIDERAAAAVIDALLRQCQGHRRGSFSRVLLELRADGDSHGTKISLDLPARMRVDRPDGSHLVLSETRAFAWTGAQPAQEVEEPAGSEAMALRDLLGMALLQPLTTAAHSERIDANRIAVRDAEDRAYELVYDPTTDVPESLSGPAGQVRFVAFLDTGPLRVPRVVELGSLGRRTLSIVETGWRFDPTVFAPPAAPDRPPDIVIGGTAGTSIPRVVDVEGCSWLLCPDPGDWTQRLAVCAAAADRLGPKGYTNAGDPLLLAEGDVRWLVVPYRPSRDTPEPVETRDGEQVREVPAHRCVSVHPDDGAWEDRLAAGRAAVLAFIQEKSLVASGPERVMVNLFAVDANDLESALRITPLQIAIPIEH